MEYFLTWLILRMTAFKDMLFFLVAIGIAGILIIVFAAASQAVYNSKREDLDFMKEFVRLINMWKIRLITYISIILMLLNLLIPTTKEMVAIILIPKIITNEHVNNISSNTLKIIEKLTDVNLKELILKELGLKTNSTKN